MNRIEERLSALQERKEKAFITYVTAGLPDMDKTSEILKAMEEAGTDIVELGIPFSDPAADGPVIQDASYQAILNGANLTKVFDMLEKAREDCNIPVVFMMYYNTILHYGLEAFRERCIETGVDGLIIPDLPFEEQEPLKEVLAANADSPILIQLVSPVSAGRIPMILENARGFVYCVSSMGVTGGNGTFHKNVIRYLQDVKKQSSIPVMMGFGIRQAKDVDAVRDTIDGCIVGSHFIRLMQENHFETAPLKEYCETFKKELNTSC